MYWINEICFRALTGNSVVGKELHIHVGMGINGDIREPMWCNGSTLAQNARDMGSILALCTIFPIYITPMTIVIGQSVTEQGMITGY